LYEIVAWSYTEIMSLKTHPQRQFFNVTLGAAFILLAACAVAQPLTPSYKLTGDVGGAVYGTQSVIRSKNNQTTLLPYLFADYGPFFARVDTFGLKALPLGNGSLELIGRVSQDGWRASTAPLNGLKDRKTALPIGLGTFQQTAYGAFIFNAFVDAGPSRGSLLEATYLAEVKLGSLSLYPMLGIESRSAKYANYYYGVPAAESLASGYAAYNAGSSTTPVMGLAADYSLTENWVVNMQLRRKWLDSAVTGSPLVTRKTQDMGYIGLSYRFK
jgi:MipA family protein